MDNQVYEKGLVSAGHHLAAEAAAEILSLGGNAVDAGVAGGLALGVVQSDYVNIGGVAPIMVRTHDGQVRTIDGVGPWPAATDPDYLRRTYGGHIPTGVLRSVVPAAPAAWIAALDRYGTMSFCDVSQAAIRFAAKGFPMHWLMRGMIEKNRAGYAKWPSNAAIYLPNGKVPAIGQNFIQTDLAATLQYMVDAERAAQNRGRAAGLQAARAAFYTEDIATAICSYHAAEGGWLRREDLSSYQVAWGEPVRAEFSKGTLLCSGAYSQGPFLAQLMLLLDRFDWSDTAPSSAAGLHRLLECVKIAFSDREACLGDPDFVSVPLGRILSPNYLTKRMQLFSPNSAMPDMPPSGLGPHRPTFADQEQPSPGDTSYIAVVDANGLAFSATPSDVSYASPVIPGTGICASPRGSASWTAQDHPSSVEPGKRPRLTPNPAIWLGPHGEVMPFGTPGGDMQIQAMAQFLLNRLYKGMSLQAAAEEPRAGSYSFPSSFSPHETHPNLVRAEAALPSQNREALSALGHNVEVWPDRSPLAGAICAVEYAQGRFASAADPRRPTGEAGA